MGLFVFLIHGAKLHSDIIGIDTEDLIRLQDDFYGGWLHTGRQGLVFLKYLFGNGHYNPYYTGMLTLLTFAVSVAAFFLLWDRIGGTMHPGCRKAAVRQTMDNGQAKARKGTAGREARTRGQAGAIREARGRDRVGVSGEARGRDRVGFNGETRSRESAEGSAPACIGGQVGDCGRTAVWTGRGVLWAWGLGGLLWISQPVMVEQFYFSLQSLEICICLILTAVALYLSYCWTESRHPALPASSIALLLITFSGYQIFVVLYIFGVVSVLLIQALGDIEQGRKITGKILLERIFPYCMVFLAAFILNSLITGLFFSSSDYLQQQFFWGQASIKDCFYGIGAHMVKAFTGLNSVFYHWGLGVLALFDLGLLICFFQKSVSRSKSVLGMLVFFYLALLITPFMLTMLIGGAPAARSQLVLPALTGFLGYLCIWLLRGILPQERSAYKTWQARGLFLSAAAVCLICGLEQTKVTESLYYTDKCRYEQDVALGRAIITQIDQVSGGNREIPVVVVGSRKFAGNNSCVMGEIIGCSFFDYDMDVEPIAFWSTRRMLGFLHSLGADFNQAPVEKLEQALEYSTYMPDFPLEYSVQAVDDIIIVKLSHYE